MDEKEYKEKLQQIEEDYKKAKRDLQVQFVVANKKFKKGDIIKDHKCTILIDKIRVEIGFMETLPSAVYSGHELKKDLTPKTNGSQNSVYGDDDVELIKEGYSE